jgi:hypothetical protein
MRSSDQVYTAFGLAIILLAGCGRSVYEPMAGAHYRDPRVDLRGLGNVALVELANQTAYPEISKGVTEAAFAALQKRQVFGVKVIWAEDPAWRAPGISTEIIPDPQDCARIRKALGCNGLLTGQVTEYRPFPHLMIGIRMRLLDLRDRQVLWGVEQIWDSSDKSVASRIKDYLSRQTRAKASSMAVHLTATSTLGFLQFVAYEVARTL